MRRRKTGRLSKYFPLLAKINHLNNGQFHYRLSGLIKNTATNQGRWMSNNSRGRMTVRSNYNENNHIIKGLRSPHKIVGLTIEILVGGANFGCGALGLEVNCDAHKLTKIYVHILLHNQSATLK